MERSRATEITANLTRWVREVDERHPRREDFTSPGGIYYIKSYLVVRVIVGTLGVALPILLLAVNSWVSGGADPVHGSISAYYHTGARDVFVGVLFIQALFLVFYMMFHRDWDNRISTAAGILCLLVAVLPTTGGETLTPLQERLGPALVGRVHFIVSALFILLLAVISYQYGRREGKRKRRASRRSPRFWRNFHWAMSGLIVLAVLGIAGVKLLQAEGYLPTADGDKTVLVGEWLAVWAFGFSWLFKGLELDVLTGGLRRERRRDPLPQGRS